MANKPTYDVYLYFTTCTTTEAIDEINIMLKRTGYALISEENYVDSHESEHEDDWFDDYDFTFKTAIQDDETIINRKLSEVGLSFEIIDPKD